MVGNGWKWLEMVGNGWKCIPPGMVGNGWKWLEMVGDISVKQTDQVNEDALRILNYTVLDQVNEETACLLNYLVLGPCGSGCAMQPLLHSAWTR